MVKVTRNSSGLAHFPRDSLGKKQHLSKSGMPSEEAPQCFGECVHVGSRDGKVGAGARRCARSNRDRELVCRGREEETRGHESSLAPRDTHTLKANCEIHGIILVPRDIRETMPQKPLYPRRGLGPTGSQAYCYSCSPEAHFRARWHGSQLLVNVPQAMEET